MGFNYPYCGCADVEAFVAAQHEGATQQLALFVKFVSRPPYLPALRDHNWAAFAKAYNGPGYAQNKYDSKLAAAYKRWSADLSKPVAAGGAAKRTAKVGRSVSTALPPGRESFAMIGAIRRDNLRRRNVRPDPVDLRDWEYRPNIAIAPRDTLLPNDPAATKQQAQTNACTGFALAAVIEYLLDRGQRPVETMSGFMLYSMARRYDEWSDEDDNSDSGSSLRGALKGWSKHGASAERLWRTINMPPATNDGKRLVAGRGETADGRVLPHRSEEHPRHARGADRSGRDLRQRLHSYRLGQTARTHAFAGADHRRRGPADPGRRAAHAIKGMPSPSSATPAMASSCRTPGAPAGAAAALPCCATTTG